MSNSLINNLFFLPLLHGNFTVVALSGLVGRELGLWLWGPWFESLQPIVTYMLIGAFWFYFLPPHPGKYAVQYAKYIIWSSQTAKHFAIKYKSNTQNMQNMQNMQNKTGAKIKMKNMQINTWRNMQIICKICRMRRKYSGKMQFFCLISKKYAKSAKNAKIYSDNMQNMQNTAFNTQINT